MARKKNPKDNIKPKKMEYYGQQAFWIHPNQKEMITAIAKPRPPFCSVEERYMYTAMQRLSGNEFKLFMYLCDNADKFRYALSAEAVSRKCGISKDSYKKCVNRLIEEGYIIHFNEYLPCENCKIIDCKKKPEEKRNCKNTWWFSPRSKYDMEDIHEFISRTGETYEEGFKYQPDDFWDDGTMLVDDENEYFWRSDKFEYYGQEE